VLRPAKQDQWALHAAANHLHLLLAALDYTLIENLVEYRG